MHTYTYVYQREVGKYLYTVVFVEAGSEVRTPLEDFADENEARALVNYLNGGAGFYPAENIRKESRGEAWKAPRKKAGAA